MKKKLIIGIIVVIVLACIIGIYLKSSNTSNKKKENSISQNSKILVVYFSAQNHTKKVAEKIADNLNADIFEIIPKDVYTQDDLDYTNDNSRVSKEYRDESLRNIELEKETVDNFADYDVVLIGYPIWWNVAAWPVDTFVTSNDFTKKTVIPFCTSASSGIENSVTLLKSKAKSGNWVNAHRFSSNASDKDIKNWTDSLTY